MGVLDDFIVNAKTAVDTVGKKAGQIADISKLRVSVADLNNDISKKFESLGKTVYEAKKTGQDQTESVSEAAEEIDDLYDQLAAVNQQLAAVRERTICKSCGTENPQGAVYCVKCGHKLSDE